jgi:hypothetical protein
MSHMSHHAWVTLLILYKVQVVCMLQGQQNIMLCSSYAEACLQHTTGGQEPFVAEHAQKTAPHVGSYSLFVPVAIHLPVAVVMMIACVKECLSGFA